MENKICFFIGHREASDKLIQQVQAEVERHIVELGVTDFIVGRYGGFDALAAKAVKHAKERHPEVTLGLLSPYHPGERPIEKPDWVDYVYYPTGMESVPKRFAILRANRYMVDTCTHLIAYAWHPASNAKDLVEYAEKRRCIVTNLGILPNTR